DVEHCDHLVLKYH
ncbi:hypothetical protein PRIPAC_73191, partial [Pristionchus pacificus]